MIQNSTARKYWPLDSRSVVVRKTAISHIDRTQNINNKNHRITRDKISGHNQRKKTMMSGSSSSVHHILYTKKFCMMSEILKVKKLSVRIKKWSSKIDSLYWCRSRRNYVGTYVIYNRKSDSCIVIQKSISKFRQSYSDQAEEIGKKLIHVSIMDDLKNTHKIGYWIFL